MANRMVFLLAKLVGWAFNSDRHANMENLHSIRKEIEEWNESKGPTFDPILCNSRSAKEGRAWPEIW
jgi:hypothetical protein